MSAVQLMAWRSERGLRRVLVLEGRRWLQAVEIDAGGLSIHRPARSEIRYMRPLVDYPLRRAVKHYRRAVREFGASKEARALIKRAADCTRNGQLAV